uniref:HMA domain-containing protein n=1 Tax=Noccaea caerulescens TaxID=107243 RepID=A0A1J3E2X2_NOCCA
MANPTPPVRTCVLRVGIKCCKGCQTNAKRKLLSVSGVSAVEYDAEQGLLTVSGDPNPATLLRKLTKWGKNAELVSVLGDASAPAPCRTPEHNQPTMAKKKKRPTKCILFRCFGKRIRKAKVEPYRGSWVENRGTTPFINAVTPPMVYPPPQAMPGFATPIPYPPPYFGEPQPPYTGGMFRPAPPQSPSYIQLRQTQFPQMVNSRLHYPHH